MAGLESLRRTPVYNIANALVGVSETRRTVNHGHLIFVGHEGSMTRYMIPMDGSRADMSAYSRDVAKKLIDCEGYEGAMFFDEDGRLKGMEMAVDVSLRSGMKGSHDIFSGYELSNYGIKGGEIGPKFGYACALTSCDSGITAIVHSRDKRVAVIKHGRPIWVYK
ncbi:MAG: hypothetical protein HZB66_02670, partial [Candidatus Aenigmarchaeota archaeon]|nr:hypothetical protein [Candidatus Aenigmarchaeota archaeon]